MDSRRTVWERLRQTVRKAERRFRHGDEEGLHDVRVALRRIAVIAEAGGRPKVARGAGRLVRRLSPLRQLEVDRQLVAELGKSGAVAPQDARIVDALLGSRYARSRENVEEIFSTREGRKLDERLGHARRTGALKARLARRTEQPIVPPAALDDDAMHRLRIAIKKRRYALMARRELGVPDLEKEIARWASFQDALGRANDWRSFRRDLVRLRERRRPDPAVDPALDEVFALATERADQTRRAARDLLAAGGIVSPEAPQTAVPPSSPRDPAVAVGARSLLRDVARSRTDS